MEIDHEAGTDDYIEVVVCHIIVLPSGAVVAKRQQWNPEELEPDSKTLWMCLEADFMQDLTNFSLNLARNVLLLACGAIEIKYFGKLSYRRMLSRESEKLVSGRFGRIGFPGGWSGDFRNSSAHKSLPVGGLVRKVQV